MILGVLLSNHTIEVMKTKNKNQPTAKNARKKVATKGSSDKKDLRKNGGEKNLEQEEFPGYPPYAPSDDIMQRNTRAEGNLDGETFSDLKKGTLPKITNASESDIVDGVEDELKPTNNEFDVSKEDLEALGPEDLSLDMGDDEELKHRATPVDFAGEDLDIPGAELDDAQEEIGSEDEENNHYSQ